MNNRLLAALACATLVTGSLGAVQASAADAKPAAEAKGKADATIPDPPAGKGQIVFFRPGKYMGMAISFTVREGETELGSLSNSHYFVAALEPGPHAFTVHSAEAKDVLNMEVEPGETYYVNGGMGMGALLYRPNLSPSTKDAFDKVAKKLKPAKAKD